MPRYTEAVDRLIEEFGKLPGIGPKTAERLAHYILSAGQDEALALADAIQAVKKNIRHCKTCYNLTEQEECDICRCADRDQTVICVVEQARDLMALERVGTYRGVYHVLLGRIAPLEGMGPEKLTLDALYNRVRGSQVREVILATNPTLEGDGTALHISSMLAGLPVVVTRLARGLASGSVLEFANKEMLADALAGRQKF